MCMQTTCLALWRKVRQAQWLLLTRGRPKQLETASRSRASRKLQVDRSRHHPRIVNIVKYFVHLNPHKDKMLWTHS